MRRSILFIVLVLLVVACGRTTTKPTSSVSSPTTSTSAPADAMERKDVTETEEEEAGEFKEYYVTVEAEDARFTPGTFSMSLTQQVELQNHDSVLHNITIPASGINLDVAPGKESYTRAISLPPGRYAFYCRIHRASGMSGFFTMTSDRDVITLRRGY